MTYHVPFEDLGKRGMSLKREVQRVLQPIDSINVKGWVAGGFLRAHLAGDPVKDVDLFFRHQEDFDRARAHYEMVAARVYETDHAVGVEHFSLPNKVDCVELVKSHFHPTLFDTLESFDFTICQVGSDGNGLWVGADFFQDVALRNLRLTGNVQGWRAIDTLRRAQKYIQLGYTLDATNRVALYNHIQAGPKVLSSLEPVDERASA